MDAGGPLGPFFGMLPREIRDKIYSYVLDIDPDKHFANGAIMRVGRQIHKETTETMLRNHTFVLVSFVGLRGVVYGSLFSPKHGKGIYLQFGARGCVTTFRHYCMRITFADEDSVRNDNVVHLMAIGTRNLVRMCRQVSDNLPYFFKSELRSKLLVDIVILQQHYNPLRDIQVEKGHLLTLKTYWWVLQNVNIRGASNLALATTTTEALKGQRWTSYKELFEELRMITIEDNNKLPHTLLLQDPTAKLVMQYYMYARAHATNQITAWIGSAGFKHMQDRFWYDHGFMAGYVFLLQALCATDHEVMEAWAVRALDGFADCRDRGSAKTTDISERHQRSVSVCGILVGGFVSLDLGREVRTKHLEVQRLFDNSAATLRLARTSSWLVPVSEAIDALEDLQNYIFNLMRDDIRSALASVPGHRLLEILTPDTTREQFSKSVVSSSRTCVCCNQIEL